MQFTKVTICWTVFISLLSVSAVLGAVSKETSTRRILRRAPSLSIPFIENKGQIGDKNVKYYAETFACRFSVTTDGRLVYRPSATKNTSARRQIVIEQPMGASFKQIRGEEKSSTKVNFYPDADSKKWFSNLPTFRLVHMGEIYTGIDMKLKAYGNNVEKLFYIQPKGNADKIRMKVEGAGNMKVTADGELRIETSSGALCFSKPVAYQYIDDRKANVEVAYKVEDKTYGFSVGKYDDTRELVIDPLINSFFIGVDMADSLGEAMVVDSAGNLFVAGNSADNYNIWKLDAGIETIMGFTAFGSITFVDDGKSRDMAIDSQNNLFVVGFTGEDSEFPVTENAFDMEVGFIEGFVAKFNPDLNLTAATYIGGNFVSRVESVSIDQNDDVYIAGNVQEYNSSPNTFPALPTGYDTVSGNDTIKKVYIVKLNNALDTMLAATFLGGNTAEDSAAAVAVDHDGNIVVTGPPSPPIFR